MSRIKLCDTTLVQFVVEMDKTSITFIKAKIWTKLGEILLYG